MKRSFIYYVLRIALVVVFLSLAWRTIRWWDGRGEGFRLYKIQTSLEYDPRWDVASTPEEIDRARVILSQPFFYLGHGFQCYAFSSLDGKYVLKFFRYQRLRLPEFVMKMPSIPIFDEWRKSRLLILSRRQDYLLRSCKTSWDLAKKETAMLMVHLNKTSGVFPTVSITDSLGQSYTVDLDDYQFLLQRKATLIKPTIIEAMKAGNIKEARACINRIFALLLHCAKRGIQDTDGALIRKNNLGFLDGKAIYIDGGKLTARKSPCTKKDYLKDLSRLRPLEKWLEIEYPLLAKHFRKAQQLSVQAFVKLRTNEKDRHTSCTKLSKHLPLKRATYLSPMTASASSRTATHM